MSDGSFPCSRALHRWIFAWVVAEMPGDRLLVQRAGGGSRACPGERLAQPLVQSSMEMGWEERKGEGESQAGQ